MVIENATALHGSDTDAAADAFAALVESRHESAYRLARLILRNETDAEDAVHDAYLAAWRRRRTLRDAARVGAWFDRILVNACRDRLRHRRRHPADELPVDLPVVRRADSAVDDRLQMEAGFRRLETDQRIVLALRFYRDMSVDQIAAVLGVPAGTVKSRIHYALKALRQALSGTTDAPPHAEDDR